MLSLTSAEVSKLKKLNTPAKIQDFLNSIPINFEGIDSGEIHGVRSPVRVLRDNSAHCFEGAILGAYILSLHGFPPLIMHLKSSRRDWDHIVTPFKIDGYWGALSKTNHAVLRYREPVYRNIRELAMSYFHEYFLDDGRKTLTSYSIPLDLNIFEDTWPYEEGDLWGIDDELDRIRHLEIAPAKSMKKLRLADKIEIEAGKIVEWKQ